MTIEFFRDFLNNGLVLTTFLFQSKDVGADKDRKIVSATFHNWQQIYVSDKIKTFTVDKLKTVSILLLHL